MQIVFDVNIVVDICARREPYYQQAVQIEQWCRDNNTPVRLYVGSVQTMQFVLAAALSENDRNSGNEAQSRSWYIQKAAELLQVYTSDIDWLAATSEDGAVFADKDPEDAQIIRAVNRLKGDALLITRHAGLLSRCEHAVSPDEFFTRCASMPPAPLAFCDLSAQLGKMRPEMESAVLGVMESTAFIKGPELESLEAELAGFSGAQHAIGCSSGTDALLIPLLALGVQPGDEILVPDFTFIATAEMVALIGARPVFIDVDPVTFNMDPTLLKDRITEKTVGIIPVSLYGQVADLDAIQAVAEQHGLWVMEDAAQSFGAVYKGKRSCSLTRIATTSFFPAKPLGGYGDGGAIFTDDAELADTMRVILNHGQSERYHHSRVGLNGRLDSMQAAVVRVKLRYFEREIQLRNAAARKYSQKLAGLVQTPVVLEHNTSTWAQYTVQVENRNAVQKRLKEKGIPTAIHYPVPLHKQEAFTDYADACNCPVTEALSGSVMSLPMHAYISDAAISAVCTALGEALK